jgi:hypothetical protein
MVAAVARAEALIGSAPKPTLALLHKVRPFIALPLAFQFGNRGGSSQHALWPDMVPSEDGITFRVRAQKGRATDRRFRVVSIPRHTRHRSRMQYRLHRLLSWWREAKTLVCSVFDSPELVTETARLWELPCEHVLSASPPKTVDSSHAE